MLFLPSPKRLLLGFLLGALLISLTTGFVIVFAVHHSSATSTAQNSLSPSMDITLGRSPCWSPTCSMAVTMSG